MRASERQELARLKTWEAQERLLSFVPTISPKFEAPVHLTPLALAIEQSRTDSVYRLVSTPPRHGKTELLLHAIAWLLQKDPSKTIGYMTYSGDLAKSKSRRARHMALKAGVQLAKGSKAVHEWRTKEGGGMLAAGLAGTWSGHGVDYAFIDDPYKGRKEAESQLIRDQVYEWFENTAYPRLEPGSSMFVVHTRWHEDDLTGRLERHPLDPWTKIIHKAISGEPESPGHPSTEEALWPSRWPLKALYKKRDTISSYAWNSIYQGTPVNPLGSVFLREWFNGPALVDIMPKVFDYRIISVDGAWQTGIGNDYSVIATWGKLGPLYYLIDVWRKRVEIHDLVAAIIAQNAKLKVLCNVPGCVYPCQHNIPVVGAQCIAVEASASGIGAIQILHRDTPLPVIGVGVNVSKTLRAESVAPLFAAGRCRFPRNAPWLGEFVEEHCSFPKGAHDDQVDSTSLALRRLQDVDLWGGDPSVFAEREDFAAAFGGGLPAGLSSIFQR